MADKTSMQKTTETDITIINNIRDDSQIRKVIFNFKTSQHYQMQTTTTNASNLPKPKLRTFGTFDILL